MSDLLDRDLEALEHAQAERRAGRVVVLRWATLVACYVVATLGSVGVYLSSLLPSPASVVVGLLAAMLVVLPAIFALVGLAILWAPSVDYADRRAWRRNPTFW